MEATELPTTRGKSTKHAVLPKGKLMAKIRQLQIPPDTSRLDFGEQIYLVSPKLRDFSGAFLEARFRPSTRVDATAHCVSALVKLGS